MTIVEFKVKKHFGRIDFYPLNEAARTVVEFKRMNAGEHTRCLKRIEIDLLKKLGFEIRIIQDLEAV